MIVDRIVHGNQPVGNGFFLLDPFGHVVPRAVLEILDAVNQLLNRYFADYLRRLKSKLLRVFQRRLAVFCANNHGGEGFARQLDRRCDVRDQILD